MSENQKPFIPSWLDEAGLSQPEFRIYCHLCRRADNATGTAWPSYGAMIETCGSSKMTIRRSLGVLEERGLIVKLGKPFGGSCRYQVLSSMIPPQGQMEAANSTTTGTIEAAPIVPPQDRNSTTRGTSIVPPEGQEGTPKKVIQRRLSKEAAFPELPFSSDQFKEAWMQWQQHRKEIKKQLTPTSVEMQFKEFTAMGESRAIAAINYTIMKGWQGIVEPSGPTSKPKPTVNHDNPRSQQKSITHIE